MFFFYFFSEGGPVAGASDNVWPYVVIESQTLYYRPGAKPVLKNVYIKKPLTFVKGL